MNEEADNLCFLVFDGWFCVYFLLCRYIREHPGVAVVDNLEDMWRVGLYQQEKKAFERKEKEKKLAMLKKRLEERYPSRGSAGTEDPPPGEEEADFEGDGISCLD